MNGIILKHADQMATIMAPLNAGDVVKIRVFRPSVVENAAEGKISTEGDYMDLEITLEVID